MDKKHLLVVDDDARLRELLEQFLCERGYLVSVAEHAAEARELLQLFIFDLAIVDVMMPDETGYEFLAALRSGPTKHKNLPVLMLTAMGEVENRIEGLEKGADDYLSKPFDPRELLLRIQSILKRQQKPVTQTTVKLGQVIYDTSLNRLTNGERQVPLTTVESELLKTLLRHTGETLSREDLMEVIDGQNPRTVDVQITRLRRKIEEDAKNPRYLQTVRGKGYTLIPDATDTEAAQ